MLLEKLSTLRYSRLWIKNWLWIKGLEFVYNRYRNHAFVYLVLYSLLPFISNNVQWKCQWKPIGFLALHQNVLSSQPSITPTDWLHCLFLICNSWHFMICVCSHLGKTPTDQQMNWAVVLLPLCCVTQMRGSQQHVEKMVLFHRVKICRDHIISDWDIWGRMKLGFPSPTKTGDCCLPLLIYFQFVGIFRKERQNMLNWKLLTISMVSNAAYRAPVCQLLGRVGQLSRANRLVFLACVMEWCLHWTVKMWVASETGSGAVVSQESLLYMVRGVTLPSLLPPTREIFGILHAIWWVLALFWKKTDRMVTRVKHDW